MFSLDSNRPLRCSGDPFQTMDSANHQAACAPGETVRVLLVEDDPQEIDAILSLLRQSKQQFEVKPVLSLRAGLARLERGGIDVVLLDISLPDREAPEIFSAVRAAFPTVPVIVLSGANDESLAVKTVQEGAQDYLVKGQMGDHLLTRAICYAIERAKVEERLSKERNLLRSIVDHLPDYIYFKDPQGRYVIDNQAHTRFLKAKTPDEVIGKTVFDFFPKELAARYHEDDEAIVRSAKPLINREEPTVNESGERRWLSTTKVPLWDETGAPEGLVCIGRDITERKVAEENLREANVELAGKKAELEQMVADLNRANAELRAMQMQLIEAEKMQSVGRLAAGIAHEVKNPLAIIGMGLDYLAGVAPTGDPEYPGIITEMKEGMKRADMVIRELLDFAASRELDLQSVSLNDVIVRSLSLVKHALSSPPVEVIHELKPDLPPVRIDQNKIEQVFINTFINATHAMPEGGKLIVRSYEKSLSQEDVLHDVGSRSGERLRAGQRVVVAEVDDSGTGIAPEKLAKLFDPFFTTKSTGKGTGLGLTVARKIIELHGGSIELMNRDEGGARVRITLRT
jgi:PAS domain S-box-containing protein